MSAAAILLPPALTRLGTGRRTANHLGRAVWEARSGRRRLCITAEKAAEDSGRFTERALVCEPIGYFQGMFRQRNGTPRQGALIPLSRGVIQLNGDYLGEGVPYSLDGLHEFSHVHVLFHFHANPRHRWSLKVAPPRLNGKRKGVFSTRAPIRPNPIGLSVVKLDRIEEDRVFVSGIDLVDGTPILDIKPYLPPYDSFPEAEYPPWIHGFGTPQCPVQVEYTEGAAEQLREIASSGNLRFLGGLDEAREGIRQVLASEPRSAYRRTQCGGRPYQFTVDNLNVRCVYAADEGGDEEGARISGSPAGAGAPKAKRAAVLVYAVEEWPLGGEQPEPSAPAPESFEPPQ